MRLFLSTVAGVLLSLAPLRATIVFTNFQSSTAFFNEVQGSSPALAVAAAFTPSANYIMTDAQVKVNGGILTGPLFDLFLYSNNGGLPGSSLGTIGTGSAPSSTGIVTVNSPALSLVSGTEYWLVMAPHDASTVVAWADGGNPVSPSAVDLFWPASNWSVQSDSTQFQIDGTSASTTPEPATLGLVGAGMLFAALRRRFTNGSK